MTTVKMIQDWCKENDVTLLYLVKFGSYLYGTNNENSDTDYKGIFLPSKRQCYLNKISKSFTYSTGNTHGKNTSNDVDIQIWSLQYFIKLVSSGETNALDLLYSHTYPEMVVYSDTGMSNVFNNHLSLFSTKDCNAYIGYAISQAKKYGIKGTRLNILKKVCNFLETIPEESNSCKLDAIMPTIINELYDASYCFIKSIKDIPSLVICGKVHQSTINIGEFKTRLFKEYKSYGERARLAEQSKGVDWKALSHAMRAICQMNELLKTGKIHYPLVTAPLLKRIKTGKYTFPEVEHMIISGLSEVDHTMSSMKQHFHTKNQKVIEDIILSFYK